MEATPIVPAYFVLHRKEAEHMEDSTDASIMTDEPNAVESAPPKTQAQKDFEEAAIIVLDKAFQELEALTPLGVVLHATVTQEGPDGDRYHWCWVSPLGQPFIQPGVPESPGVVYDKVQPGETEEG